MSVLKGIKDRVTRKRNRRGFGLIEVVIAMAILSVMAGTLGPKLYESYQIRLVEKTGVEIHYIQEAAKNYRRDTGSWPANIAALQGAGYLPGAWTAKTPWGKSYTVSTNVTSFTVTVEMPSLYKNALGTYLPNVVVNGDNVSSSTPIPGSEPSLDALLPRDGSRPMVGDLHMTGGDLKIEKDTPAIRLYNTAASLGAWLKTLANGRLSIQTDSGMEIANIDQAGTLSASGLNISGNSIVNTMTASSITTNSLTLVDGNTRLLRDTSGAIFISTVNGSGVIGPMNSSYFHFSTDRSGFKFQQPIYLGGSVYGTNSSYYLDPSGTSLLNNLNVTLLNGGAPVQSSNIGSYAVTSIVPGSNIVVTGSTGPVTVGTVQNPSFTTSVTTPLLIDPRAGNAYYVSPASASSLYSLGVGLAVITPNVYGSALAGGNLVLGSTSNVSKGKIYFGANSVYDESAGFLGIGTASPGAAIDVVGGSIRTSGQLLSIVTTGTAPLQVNSTTLVTNLNADLLDGKHASDLIPVGNISGTQNYIAKFTGVNSLGNSLIYDNGTNVGIGTATPNAKLEISGSTTPAIVVTSTNYPASYRTQLGVQGNAQGVLVLGNNGANEIRFGATNAGGAGSIYVNNTADYNSAANGTLAMSFTSSGTVGIGTSDPQGYTLRVAGTAKIDSTLNVAGGIQINGTTVIDGSSNITANNMNAKSYQLNGTTIIDTSGNLKNIATATITASLTVPTIYGSSSASGPLYLYSTSNATPGNIYLNGTTSYFDGSGARLNLQNTSVADYAGVTVTNDGANYLSVYRYGSSAAGTWAGLNKANLSRIASIGGDLFVGTWNGGNLVFGTSLPATADSAERMRITQAGLVVVGGVNANDTATFQVNNGNVLFIGNTGGYPAYRTTPGDGLLPSQTAVLMWYPAKAAFRAGQTLNLDSAWSDTNIGTNSVGLIGGSQASGLGSVAIGRTTTASAQDAVSIGIGSQATATGAMAFTQGSASGQYSIALGGTAQGPYAMAIGNASFANNNYSVALGTNIQASANYAFIIGSGIPSGAKLTNSTANSLAIGFNSDMATLVVTGGNGTAGSVGNVQVNGSLYLPSTTTTKGIIYWNSQPWIHSYGQFTNFFAGFTAGNLTMTNGNNTGIGYATLSSVTNGMGLTAVGSGAINANTSGSSNTGVGSSSLACNTTGSDNTAVGFSALQNGSPISYNTAVGYYALANSTANWNTAVGTWAMGGLNNITGTANVGIGAQTLYTLTSGGQNTALGQNAGQTLTTGSANTFVGYRTDVSTGSGALTNAAAIGANAQVSVSNAMILGDNNTTVGIGTSSPSTTYKLYVNGSAYNTTGVWNSSDIRLKKEVRQIQNPLQKILALKGITYEWRRDEFPDRAFEAGGQVGLIAQNVEEILPELVRTDGDGYKSVNYATLTAVLVEAVKELNKKVITVSHTQIIAAAGSKGQKYEIRNPETLEKLVTFTTAREGDKDVKGYISVRDVYLADTDKWASENGPKFVQPVTIYEGGSPCEFQVHDISKNLPAGARAVILEIETTDGEQTSTVARVRRGPGAACYNLIRGQGIFPVSQARTFEMAIDGVEGKEVVVKIVGYM